jgi:hypothetical protein
MGQGEAPSLEYDPSEDESEDDTISALKMLDAIRHLTRSISKGRLIILYAFLRYRQHLVCGTRMEWAFNIRHRPLQN